MELTSENVDSIFRSCLFRDGEDTSKAIVAEGIVSTFGFHPERLKEHRGDIVAMLGQLPDSFMESKGGGWSFLNACERADGEQWGEQPSVEQLFARGLATGTAQSALPRALWAMLPGGMPYFIVLDGPGIAEATS